MPAGTIALTNNSATVTGTGTSFTTELKVNDFVVSTVGGVAYTLGVKSIESNTSLTLLEKYTGPAATGQSWTPVPYGTMAAITAQLAAQVTYAIRGLNLDKANWQKIFSSDQSVTVNLPDLNSFTGPSWGYMAAQYGGKANSDDARFDTVNGKSGGTINGSVSIDNGSITASATNGISVNPGEANSVGINNSAKGGGTGNTIGWMYYRWYNEIVLAGIQRSGDTTIQSYTISISNGVSWQFSRNGNASASGSWINGSDERHKSKIKLVPDALASVLSWRGATYDKKDGVPEVGLIAQDVERSCPVAVSTTGERKFMDGTVIPDFKNLNTAGAAAAYHTEAIKALFSLVELLAIDKPDILEMVDKIKKSSVDISKRTVKSGSPWKEDPPVLELPTQEESK